MAEKKSTPIYDPVDLIFSGKLPLPSFGIDITRSAPSAVAIPAGFGNPDMSLESGDAFSVSYLGEGKTLSPADQDFLRLDPGYLRKILIRILDSEEYQTVVEHHTPSRRLKAEAEGKESPHLLFDYETVRDPDPKGQVRISDLRLANDLKPIALRRELTLVLGSLKPPVTAESILRWKWSTLKEYKTLMKKPSEWTDEDHEAERTRAVAVSFAAASLCLLADLGTQSLREATPKTLQGYVETFADIVRTLTADLDRGAEELGKLLIGRGGGRPPHPKIRYYTALRLYRMGRDLKEVSRHVGINPYDKETRQGSKDWRNKVKEVIRRGAEVEKEKLPRAAEVFARMNQEPVRIRALEAYQDYIQSANWTHVGQWFEKADVGDDLPSGVPAAEQSEIYQAYIQLGSCLVNGIEPIPS